MKLEPLDLGMGRLLDPNSLVISYIRNLGVQRL
jgi:hypothetical protein